MTTKIQPDNDNQPSRGHVYHCDHCGDGGVCCDTSAGGVVVDGVEQYYDLGGRDVLLVGDTKGGHTDGWYCENCAEEIA